MRTSLLRWVRYLLYYDACSVIILADRTNGLNGRAYATMLCPSVCRL